MTPAESFHLSLICEEPDNDALIAEYADICERVGRTDRAAFIRRMLDDPDQHYDTEGTVVDLPGYDVLVGWGFAITARTTLDRLPDLVKRLEFHPLENVELTDTGMTVTMEYDRTREGPTWTTTLHMDYTAPNVKAVWANRDVMLRSLVEWVGFAHRAYAREYPDSYPPHTGEFPDPGPRRELWSD